MQLRSGKTTQTMSVNSNDNLRFYGQIHRGNITMAMVPYTPPGSPPGTPRSAPPAPVNKSKPTIAKHSMTLRPRKIEQELENEQEAGHFADMMSMRLVVKPKPHDFREWLVVRLRGFITDFSKITGGGELRMRVLERTQLFIEMVAVLTEHIEYITSSHDFVKFSHVLYSKLIYFKNELTAVLNGEVLPDNSKPCHFSPEERAFLGNARADIVRLSVIMKPLLPNLTNSV